MTQSILTKRGRKTEKVSKNFGALSSTLEAVQYRLYTQLRCR